MPGRLTRIIHFLGILLLPMPYLIVFGEESNNYSCGAEKLSLINQIPAVLANNAGSPQVSRNQTLGMKECVEKCCLQFSCNFAVHEGSECLLVRCSNIDDCRLESPLADKILVREVVHVRELEPGCPNASRSCEVGVDNCSENEECVPVKSRGRNGCCRCLESLSQNPDGTCSSPQTTTLPTTTTPYIKKLAISISPTIIQLPEDHSSIAAIVVPGPDEGEKYSYQWTIISYPEGPQGVVEDSKEQTLKLSSLSPGNYTVKVTVSSPLSFGEQLVNFTVLPPKRINSPPVAIIRPSSQSIHLPNDVSILDGSPSSDDSGIVKYWWEMERGPISYHFQPVDVQTLKLEGLVEGNYTFKLTVTDADGKSNSTNGTVEVLKETDYPPEANAGDPVVLYLPQNEITLNGSASTDDHGIVGWEWTLLSDESKKGTGPESKPVDMQQSRTPYLHLSNLEEGMYRFQLKVTDVAGQSSTATVDVFVRHPDVKEPRVDAGPDVVIKLPDNWVQLDGSKTMDESGIDRWEWKQIQGPNDAVLSPNDKAQINATRLTKGTYVFQLTAWNPAGSSSSDNVSVTVVQNENAKPVANAGGDRSVDLPFRFVTLNGSASSDDLRIASWLWTREPESLAAGTIVANSDRTSVLMLTNLVAGRYSFRLTVTDDQGLSSYDVAQLTVRPNPREPDVVMLTLKTDPRTLTESQMTTLRDQVRLLLHQPGDAEVNVNLDDVISEPKTGRVVLSFVASAKAQDGGTWRTLRGPKVADILAKKLRNDPNLLIVPVVDVDTVLCQNNCSGHGFCDQVTRRCVCNTFWMENTFSVASGGPRNCDWSLLYVVIIVALLLMVLIAIVWSIVHFCRHRSLPPVLWSRKRRRPHRYSPLSDPAMMRMSTKLSNSLIPSDAEESETESDVVFETKRSSSNGHQYEAINGFRSTEKILA